MEEYLRSEQAASDVAALVAEVPDLRAGCAARPMNPTRPCTLWAQPEGRWVCVRMHFGMICSAVYFQVDAPGGLVPDFEPARRYIVTDLGEAVRALRVRTGHWLPVPALRCGGLGMVFVTDDNQIVALADDGRHAIRSADLPRALCVVLLAAHRVAALQP